VVGISSDESGMYDDFAEEYLAHARDGAFNAYYDRPAVLAVLGSVAGLAVLDLGCGPGLYAEELLVRGAGRIAGVDASAEMVRLARERVRGPAVFHRQDLQAPLSWAGDGVFDVAVMPLVIHHLDDRVAALREIARVLRQAVGWWCRPTIPPGTGSATVAATSPSKRSRSAGGEAGTSHTGANRSS
jgi:ubiquinone/menaquinone biosynthesis C-methylase UbiE